MISRRALPSLLALPALAGAARAQGSRPAPDDRLTIAFGDPVSSIDPQLNNFGGDRSVSLHAFDFLVENHNGTLRPGLAKSWKLIDPTTWEFTLRDDVRWHDGRPFTADDAIFSYRRAPEVPGSASSYGGYLREIAGLEAPDPHRLIVRTHGPAPLTPLNFASVSIVARHATEGATSADFNSGKAAIGTGPYRFVSYSPGDRIVFRRNDEYWGGRPAWAEVTIRLIPNAAARTAALLSGDVDVIERVSVADVDSIRRRQDVELFAHPGLRVLLLCPNAAPEPNPFVQAADGSPLARNPLSDAKVRRALSLALDRRGLAERLLQGQAVPAGQWMPEGSFGYEPALPVPAQDPESARRLLAEAGFPDGFRLTLHVPSDRYIRGPETAQAVAQAWTRIGVRTTVENMPWATFSGRAAGGQFAMSVLAWGNGTGEASYALVNVIGSYDPAKGRGASNWGRYASQEADRLLEAAVRELDDGKREAILQESARLVMGEGGIIPIFHYRNLWAARRGLSVSPLVSDRTAAMMVRREG
ncbi:ABC transporter substrate-binding protein [Roseomonas xinghualingensis]|uniref:ABC transporter substrate-binding protein n=1 Tax=Roseomonas xinghualingensis TaxID=2986475 RepID=UPI0021F166EC|nr:ABC transporter substrate-binding protein [Roseomonas sp. SXEYE001]MCV4209276.1 ABC transporter substrate-binding protein [Roseomonas sp. SXEYE001]